MPKLMITINKSGGMARRVLDAPNARSAADPIDAPIDVEFVRNSPTDNTPYVQD